MRIRPFIEAAFARDWEFEEVDHYPLLEDLNNTLRQIPASFARDSGKNVILNERLVRKDPGVPVFLDEYLDLTVNGLMLEQQDSNRMLQTGNMSSSPWGDRMDMSINTAPGIAPSDTFQAFRLNIRSSGLNWEHAWGQSVNSSVNGYLVHSAMFKSLTAGTKYAILTNWRGSSPGTRNHGIRVPLPSGALSRYASQAPTVYKGIQVGEWRYIEGRVNLNSATDRNLGFGGLRSGNWSYYGFAMTLQERFYSSKIFSTNAPGIRAPDILTVKSPQGLKENKISFDFQYMPQGHSQEYEAVNINDGDISVYIREISTSEQNPVENEPNIIIKKSRLRVKIRGDLDTDYNFQDIVVPDINDATYNVEILSTRENNIRVKITVNDEEHEADGILRGDVLLAEDMTISGWCVLSNLTVYKGY